jgi:hypothetical protein
MAKNQAELVYQTLRNLGALPMGQDPNDEEFNQVNGLVDSVVDMLRKLDVYYLPDVDVIPEEAFLPLAHVMAGACAANFGQQADDRILALAQQGQNLLQTMQSERPYYETLEVQAY